jgi:hypothetical protein
VYLFEFEQVQAEGLDLRKNAEQCRSVLQRAGEYRLVVLQLGHHRGKGGQGGSSKPSLYPNRVQARRRGHVVIMYPDPVSHLRPDQVIVARAEAVAWLREVQERLVDRSRNSRAWRTAEDRSRTPSLE